MSGGGQSAEAGEESNAGRLLDPSTGRFDRPDPLRDDEKNPYPYVRNNPVNTADPSGNAPPYLKSVYAPLLELGGSEAQEQPPQLWAFSPKSRYKQNVVGQLVSMGVLREPEVSPEERGFPKRFRLKITPPYEGGEAQVMPSSVTHVDPSRVTRCIPLYILEINTDNGPIKFLYVREDVLKREFYGASYPHEYLLVSAGKPGASDLAVLQGFTLPAAEQAAEKYINDITFVGSFVPGVSALDNFTDKDGSVGEGLIYLASDILLVAGLAAKAARSAVVAQKIALGAFYFEAGVGFLRSGQSVYYVIRGDQIKAREKAADAALRLLGAYLIRPRPVAPEAVRGRWVKESTAGWSDRAKAYQQQITGRPAGEAFEVNGRRFDGPSQSGSGLVDAKGSGYGIGVKNRRFVTVSPFGVDVGVF